MNKEKVYVIGNEYDDFSSGGFNILYIVKSLEEAQTKIKEIIKETKENNEEIEWTEEERQDYIKSLKIREFVLNDKYTGYKEIKIKI